VQEEIARIRAAEFTSAAESTPSFALSRRGYDRDEVNAFLSELADSLERIEAEREDSAQRSGSEAIRRELELMSQKTADVLTQAEESAERLRSEATQEASRVLARAREEADAVKQAVVGSRETAEAERERVEHEMEAYAARIRAEADADAQALRAQAAGELAGAVERATVEARASVQAEDEQRSQLSGELEQLAARRDAAREELRKIAGVLSDAVGVDEAVPAQAPADDAAKPGSESDTGQSPLRAA